MIICCTCQKEIYWSPVMKEWFHSDYAKDPHPAKPPTELVDGPGRGQSDA